MQICVMAHLVDPTLGISIEILEYTKQVTKSSKKDRKYHGQNQKNKGKSNNLKQKTNTQKTLHIAHKIEQ